ncbi:putative glycosyl hydrolase, family 18 [Acephala macrosclerotiorum]|nr:putative glycosyl hydrolase, family 18 [Acephala macrosclerotiorum]
MHCTALLSIAIFCNAVLSTPLSSSYGRYSPYASGRLESTGLRAVGYFGNWDIYARNFFVTDIDTSQLTHLMYSFANINTTTGEVILSDEWADLQYPYPGDDTSANGTNVYGGIKQLFLLKKKKRSLKTMLSILGATYSAKFSPILESESLRANFASTALKLMTDLGFDGIDIDYEYVQNATEASNMVDLLSKLRSGMDAISSNTSCSPFLLSYASPAGPLKYTQLDMPGMDQYLDFWNYMGFDYAGAWDTIAGHSSNLFASKDNPLSTPFNTSTAINYYLTTGQVPASKINLGSPLYAHAFAGTEGPGKPFNGTGTGGSFGIAGIWDYKALPVSGYNATVYNSKKLGASWSYDSAKKYMISYDTPAIAKEKAQWIMKMGLGGSMWWEVSMDKNGTESLIGSTVKTFGGVKVLDSSENHLSYPTSKYENLRKGFPGE